MLFSRFYVIYRSGKHELITELNNNNIVIEPNKLQAIFENQESSKVLNDLINVKAKRLQKCCQDVSSRLNKNVEDICIETTELYLTWLEERQFRITGSDAYSLFTYQKNKKPDWKRK